MYLMLRAQIKDILYMFISKRKCNVRKQNKRKERKQCVLYSDTKPTASIIKTVSVVFSQEIAATRYCPIVFWRQCRISLLQQKLSYLTMDSIILNYSF